MTLCIKGCIGASIILKKNNREIGRGMYRNRKIIETGRLHFVDYSNENGSETNKCERIGN